jgi:outer membrane protein
MVLSAMLVSAPAFAQTPAPAPAAPAAPAQAAPAPAPFPAGVKYAFIDIQRIANESGEGKAATAKVQALNQQRVNDLNEKNKALQAQQQKLESGGNVMSEAARAQLQREIDRLTVDIQRFTQDAQAEVQELQQTMMADFQRKLGPVIQQVAEEKGLQLLFSAADSGLVWADPGLDLTAEVIKRFDSAPSAAAGKPAAPAAPKPAPPPAAAPKPTVPPAGGTAPR